jgi:hypothetical protein
MTSTGGGEAYSPAVVGVSTAMSMGGPAAGLAPRRAASDAAFWAGKRGARDWGGSQVSSSGDAVAAAATAAGRDAQAGDAPGAGEEDGEWDVEGAARGRVVQLMFTVPRERLRVVNADVDGRSVASGAAEDEGAETHDRETDAEW